MHICFFTLCPGRLVCVRHAQITSGDAHLTLSRRPDAASPWQQRAAILGWPFWGSRLVIWALMWSGGACGYIVSKSLWMGPLIGGGGGGGGSPMSHV